MTDSLHNIKRLKNDFEVGKPFTLYVGAGINASKSVKLLWNDIIRDACKHSFRIIGNEYGIPSADMRCIFDTLKLNKDIEVSSDICNARGYEHEDCNRRNELREFTTTHFPVEVQVSIIKTLLGNSYIPFIQQYLYSECNPAKIKKCFQSYVIGKKGDIVCKELYTLYVIARMILLNPNIQRVITYNYDNFLSTAIEYLLHNYSLFFSEDEVKFLLQRYAVNEPENLKSVVPVIVVRESAKAESMSSKHAIPIFHVHGYIPALNELQDFDESGIVLSLDEYFDSWSDTSSWRTTVQQFGIQTTNALFIGSSLTDLSTKRILNLSALKETGLNVYSLDAFIRKEQTDKWNNSKKSLRKIRNVYLESLGVKVIDWDKGFESLFSEIYSINGLSSKQKTS